MRLNETSGRVRTLLGTSGSSSIRSTRRTAPARSRVREASERQPPQAWSKEKGGRQTAFPFPRPCLLVLRFFAFVVDESGVRQSLADNLSAEHLEALSVIQLFSVDIQPRIKPERLFIDISKEMEGFNGNIRAVNPELQQRLQKFSIPLV